MKEILTRIFAAVVCEIILLIFIPIILFMFVVGLIFMPALCLVSKDLIVKDWFIFKWKKNDDKTV